MLKTGLYIIVTYKDLIVVPNKKTNITTIESHLNDLWYNDWSGLKGHGQTKYWLTRPDPFLASKLMNMSRENSIIHRPWGHSHQICTMHHSVT